MTPPEKKIFTRREALTLIAAASAGCITGKFSLMKEIGILHAEEPEGAAGEVACILTPKKGEGPFFLDGALERSDIRSSPGENSPKTGVPLDLKITVLHADRQCAPASGLCVDIWHADAEGRYSDAIHGDPGREKFLRGYQITGMDGSVGFQTIYPGWYRGRTIHIHLKIRTSQKSKAWHSFDTQLFFSEAVNDEVMVRNPYNTRGPRKTTNAADYLYNDERELLLPVKGTPSTGYSGAITIGIKDLPA